MASDKSITGLRRSTRPKRRSLTGRLYGWSWRLFFLYSLITVSLRCPASSDAITEQTPAVCKIYFDGRDQLLPTIKPYYDEYAAPYVALVQPYTETFNSKLYAPASTLIQHQYRNHGAPYMVKGQAYLHDQWKQLGAPYTDKALAYISTNYGAFLEPYVDQATKVTGPFIKTTKDTAVHHYRSTAIPFFHKAQPQLQKVYNQGKRYTFEVALPYGQWAGQKSLVFVTRKMWPALRVLYGENIEPQVYKIRERLASYRDGKKLEAAVDAMTSLPALPIGDSHSTTTVTPSPTESVGVLSAILESVRSLTHSSSTLASSTSEPTEVSQETDSSINEPTIASEPAQASATVEATEIVEDPVAQPVSEELRLWEEKFTKASDIGKADLQERVSDISTHQIEQQVKGLGEALLTQLEEAASSAISNVEQETLRVVENLPENPSSSDTAAAEEQVHDVVRSTAGIVKARAQDVRSWKLKFDQNTRELVEAALESTLNVIDHIRDLGLQEIGMRWASLPEVTYKDWAAYHTLKKNVDEWRIEVEDVAMKHAGLERAKSEGEDMESRAMTIAEETAKELARLKKVSTRKIEARDSSNNFDTENTVLSILEDAGEKVREGFSGASQAVLCSAADEAVAAGSSLVESATSTTADMVDEVYPSASSVASEATEGAEAFVHETAKPIAQSVLSAPKFKAVAAEESTIGTPPPPLHSTETEGFTSFTNDAMPTGTIAPSAHSMGNVANDMINNGAHSTSMSIQSAIGKAGTAYADVTNSIARAFSTPAQSDAEQTVSHGVFGEE